MNSQRIQLIARVTGFITVLLVAVMLAGCVNTPPTAVHQPMTARPAPKSDFIQNAGAIYQPGGVRPLFEDRRARYVGDTLVINISERTQAAKKSASSADRKQDIEMGVPTITGLPGKSLQGATVEANSANAFSGKGASSADNNFTGTITVTVIEVRRAHQGSRLGGRCARQPARRLRPGRRPRRLGRPDHADPLHRAEHRQHARQPRREPAARHQPAAEERRRGDGHRQPAAFARPVRRSTSPCPRSATPRACAAAPW
jgi:hypothetical protein